MTDPQPSITIQRPLSPVGVFVCAGLFCLWSSGKFREQGAKAVPADGVTDHAPHQGPTTA